VLKKGSLLRKIKFSFYFSITNKFNLNLNNLISRTSVKPYSYKGPKLKVVWAHISYNKKSIPFCHPFRHSIDLLMPNKKISLSNWME
jgi:hypothetical protein